MPTTEAMIDPVPMFCEAIAPWHRKFAWLPVYTYDQGVKWLCHVERRRIQKKPFLSGPDMRWWQYRAVTTEKVPAPGSDPNTLRSRKPSVRTPVKKGVTAII